jgi:hypothetical protein
MLLNFETVSSEISATCIRASVTLRSVTSLRTNIVKDDKDNLVTNFHNILARWRKHLTATECT